MRLMPGWTVSQRLAVLLILAAMVAVAAWASRAHDWDHGVTIDSTLVGPALAACDDDACRRLHAAMEAYAEAQLAPRIGSHGVVSVEFHGPPTLGPVGPDGTQEILVYGVGHTYVLVTLDDRRTLVFDIACPGNCSDIPGMLTQGRVPGGDERPG